MMSLKNMEVLTLNRLQHHSPGSDEASEDDGGKRINSLLIKDFMNPSQLGLTFEGNNLSEYFGLAMAICAVGLLRNACPGSEVSNNSFSKEATHSRVGEGAVMHLVPRSQSLAKQENDSSSKAEQSLILQKIMHLQGELLELKRLRSEDGKANERVVSFFASKEQDWKVERKKLREEQKKLYQELQRASLQQEALCSKLKHLRSLHKPPCSECEHKEGIFVELKERLGEKEFLIMATMEEVQIERQEKNVIVEKLTAVELSVSQLQEELSLDAEHHTLELAMRDELVKQLENQAEQMENDNSRILQELTASQASLSAVIHEKTQCKELMSREIEELQTSVQVKDDIIFSMLKKANADAEDRKVLENEVAFMKAKLDLAEREKQKWRRLVQMNARSSSKSEAIKPKSSFESRSVPVAGGMIEDLQKLHDTEIKSLQTVFEEQVQMLQKRLNLCQERVAELEEDTLLRMTDTKRMIKYSEHVSLIHGAIGDNKSIVALQECVDTELASKQFQLSVAKTLIKQLIDSEAYREQEIERWKKLYFESKTIVGFHKEKEETGAVVPRSPKLQDWLELEKSRHTYKLEQRHLQEIDAFERQMRARDERMEAFRWHLLHLEDEVQRARHQLETFKQSLATAYDDRRRIEEILKQKEDELVA